MPHVYVPADQSVPAMFADRGELFAGRKVLDMGTGTGILALLAALAGAVRVVATDFNPNAVRNARLNAGLLGLQDRNDGRLDYNYVNGDRGARYQEEIKVLLDTFA